MFSRSTFQRYLFDIRSTQQQTADAYRSLLDNLKEESLRQELSGFLDQVQTEAETIEEVRKLFEQTR